MKIKAIWDLLRLEHGLMYGIGVIIGAVVASKNVNFLKILLGFLTAVFLQASAFSLNDYIDYETDLENKRYDRPLVRGDLSRHHALILCLILAPPGFLASYLISIKAFLFAFIITLLGYLYDIKIKKFGLAGNVYIALSMAAPFIFGGIIAIDNINPAIIMLSLLAFLSGVAREIMKGIEDIKGDAIRDIRTLARVKGIAFASKTSSLIYILAVILSFIPFLLIQEYKYDLKYLIPVLITDAILIKTSYELVKPDVTPKKISKLRKLTLIGFLFGLVGFILGAF